jgi:type IV pilus assembly protein PilA
MATLNKKQGFTLIEILLVIAAISILAAIVIVAINPAKQLASARNAQRRSNVNAILNAISQYSLDNNGTVPSGVVTNATCSLVATKEVCKLTATGTCSTGEDLSVITTSEKYLVSMPIDPTVSSADGTGYYAVQSTNGRITVCAPSSESEGGTTPTISITR